LLPTSTYTLSLHDALPICPRDDLVDEFLLEPFAARLVVVGLMRMTVGKRNDEAGQHTAGVDDPAPERARLPPPPVGAIIPEGDRSEEHTSELQSRENLVCR